MLTAMKRYFRFIALIDILFWIPCGSTSQKSITRLYVMEVTEFANIRITGITHVFSCYNICTISRDSVDGCRNTKKIRHYGTEFYLGMIPNYHLNYPDITIDIASEAPGMAQLYVPFLNVSRMETLQKGQTTLTVKHELIKRGNFTEQRGIQIKTNVTVAVYVTSFGSATSPDTYMALPVNSMGNVYMIASYQPVNDAKEKSEIAIVSAYPNTTVNISNRGVVNLDRLYISQVVDDSDLTGTIVSSTKPVVVISGASCAEVPVGSRECDIVVEQMLPVSSWTNAYIVPPLPPKTGYIVRVQALDTSRVCVQNSTRLICNQMTQKSYDHFLLGSEPTVVYSNESSKFSVTQYGTGHSVVNSGPFMIVIPGLNNYVPKYSFAVPSVYSKFNNYLSVIVKKSDSTGLLLDGMPLQTMYTYTVPKPLDQYVVLVSNVSAGYHTLKNRDGTVAFGAFLYGLLPNQGYGTPLGMKYSSDRIDEGPMCYNCQHVHDTGLCMNATRCGIDEFCGIEKYRLGNDDHYKMGCASHRLCTPMKRSGLPKRLRRSTPLCSSCCSGDLCNTNCTLATDGSTGQIIVG